MDFPEPIHGLHRQGSHPSLLLPLVVAQAALVAEVRSMLAEVVRLRSETTYQLLRGVRTLLLLGPEAHRLETPIQQGETLHSYQ